MLKKFRLKSFVSIAAMLMLCLGLMACGSSGSSKVDPVEAKKAENKEAVEVVNDFVQKASTAKYLSSAEVLQILDDLNNNKKPTISVDDFTAVMQAISEYYAMEDELLAALKTLNKNTTKASMSVAQKAGVFDIIEKAAKLFSRSKEQDKNKAQTILNVLNSQNEQDQAIIWNTLQDRKLTFDAKDYTTWMNNLKNGDYNKNSSKIRDELAAHAYDADGFPIFAMDLSGDGKNRAQLVFESAVDIIETAEDAGALILEVGVTGLETATPVFKAAREAAEKAVGVYNSFKDDNVDVKELVKNFAPDVIQDAEKLYNAWNYFNVDPALNTDKNKTTADKIKEDKSGVGGVQVTDQKSENNKLPKGSLVIMTNESPESGSPEIIIATINNDEQMIPTPPGDYNVAVITPEGTVGVSQDVVVEEEAIAEAEVDTSKVEEPVAPEPKKLKLEITGTSIIITPDANIAKPYDVTIKNPDEAQISKLNDDKFSGDKRIELKGQQGSNVVVGLATESAKTYKFTVTVKDADKKTYTATISTSTKPEEPPAGDDPKEDTKGVVYKSGQVIHTEADKTIWKLTISLEFLDDKTVKASGSGTVENAIDEYKFNVTFSGNGTWNDSMFKVTNGSATLSDGGGSHSFTAEGQLGLELGNTITAEICVGTGDGKECPAPFTLTRQP